jgi:hypothetical protein
MTNYSALVIVNLEICVQNLSYSVPQKWNTEPLITAHIIFTYETKAFKDTCLSDVGCEHVNFTCAYITIIAIHKCIPGVKVWHGLRGYTNAHM